MLRLVRDSEDWAERQDQRPFRLDASARRPGAAHESVVLSLPPADMAAVRRRAKLDRIPPGLWAAIAVESERVLVSLARKLDPGELDAAARWPRALTGEETRLWAYARALRAGAPHVSLQEPLELPVPYHTHWAWRLAAGGEETSVEEWASRRVSLAPCGRHRWEAAAAESGATLAEWIALHAAARI